MPQLVFIHGPGAGGCAEAWRRQHDHFSGSLAPTLPGVFEGEACADVPRYMEWVRGWLWAQRKHTELVLVGYTLGSQIALQYALDYPGEVKGVVLTAASAGAVPRHANWKELRLEAAAGDAAALEKWRQFQVNAMEWVDPAFREALMACHDKAGPLAQYKMIVPFYGFDVRERIHTLKPRVLLIRGADDPLNPPDSEKAIHEKVPGSTLVYISNAGHFPATEQPGRVNELIEDFLSSL